MIRDILKVGVVVATATIASIAYAAVVQEPLHLIADSSYKGNIITFEAVVPNYGLVTLGTVGPDTFLKDTFVPDQFITEPGPSSYYVQVSILSATGSNLQNGAPFCSTKPTVFKNASQEGVVVELTNPIDPNDYTQGACKDILKKKKS